MRGVWPQACHQFRSRAARARAETLRISIQDDPEYVILKLEGRVVGPWVEELERAWRPLIPSLGAKKLRIDLRGVSYMDTNGRKILAEIYKQTGADFLADTPMTKYFADEARLKN